MPEEKVIRLPYGNNSLPVRVPVANLVSVLRRRKAPALEDEVGGIREALRHPIGSFPLRERLSPGDNVSILVTDNTRACPDDRLLPVILEEVESRVPRRNIRIIVALGLHPPLDAAALEKKLGREIVANYTVLNHDPASTVFLGMTSRGIPVEIFREAAPADFIISTGFIEPHFFAGFSGGSKSIAPGISSRRAIAQNHSYLMLAHHRARAGLLEGNPVHEDIVEQARLAGLDFIVNVLLDGRGKITHVVAGDPVAAHERGCVVERELAGATLDHAVDITIVSNGGAPLDLDLYQTCKGIDTAAAITRPGGTVIVASSCWAGIGPEAFFQLHASCGSPAEVLEKIRRGDFTGVPWQNQILARCQMEHDIYLVSALPPQSVRRMMIRPIGSVEEGIREAMSRLSNRAEMAVIPEGPHVLPILKER